MAAYAVMCMSIITGINLVCHEYCIVTWRKNPFRDLFINCYMDNPSFDELLLEDLSNSQETFVEGRRVCFWRFIGVSTLHVRARSPKSHNQNAISSERHVMWCSSIKALVVRWWYGLVNTLGLYVNTLEYTELLNRLIFDRVYGS